MGACLFPCTGFAVEWSGFKSPNHVIYDPSTRTHYISNINGKWNFKDNNGFISKVHPEGKSTNHQFIRGGQDNIQLHAPKGMLIFKNELFVADIDTLRRFDKNTGKLLGTIDLKVLGARSLNGITLDGQGILYVSDTLGNAIYKINMRKSFQVTRLVRSRNLGQPSGILYDHSLKKLFVAAWGTGGLLLVDRKGKIGSLPTVKLKTPDGIARDREGNLLVSSYSWGAVYRIIDLSRVEVVKGKLRTPAKIYFDYSTNRILIPLVRPGKVVTHALN